jgi:hypothetical protein
MCTMEVLIFPSRTCCDIFHSGSTRKRKRAERLGRSIYLYGMGSPRSEDFEHVDDGGVAERAAAAAGQELTGAAAAEGAATGDEGGALGPRHAHAAATGDHAPARRRLRLRVVRRFRHRRRVLIFCLRRGVWDGAPLSVRLLQEHHQGDPLVLLLLIRRRRGRRRRRRGRGGLGGGHRRRRRRGGRGRRW